jgi:hypothetical protein
VLLHNGGFRNSCITKRILLCNHSLNEKANIFQNVTTFFYYFISFVIRQDHYEAQFLSYAHTILRCNRCKIHRYVVAPFSHDIVGTSYNTYCIFNITHTTSGANWMIQLFLLGCIRLRDLPISRILYISLPEFFSICFVPTEKCIIHEFIVNENWVAK